jgi:L1 cell adhesion molecule like protein
MEDFAMLDDDNDTENANDMNDDCHTDEDNYDIPTRDIDDGDTESAYDDYGDTEMQIDSVEDNVTFDVDLDDDSVKSWSGFKIVGDNIDKTVRPSFERINSHNISLHYFHAYAVLDRIDLSDMSDMRGSGVCDFNKLLPSLEDISLIKDQYKILISR